MPKAGHVFKAVSAQLAEMDEMDVPDKEWSIFDEDFLSTEEVISVLTNSKVPSHNTFADQLADILCRESEEFEED